MKGLVFTTFYSWVEERYGVNMLDDIIRDADPPNKGAYTSVGTYSFRDMVALVTALTKRIAKPPAVVLEDFGHACFGRWVRYAPAYFDHKDLFDILGSIDHFHEHEVRKLYPDAQLPSFKVESRSDRTLVLHYFSSKPLADLATGVIKGAADHLGESIEVQHWPVGGAEPYVRFQVNRTAQ